MRTLEAKSYEHPGMTPAVFFKKTEAGKKTVYPESDGKPMADNTEQYEWIVLIKENLETMFADSPDVFVAADLLWYPVKEDTNISAAPDVMVAFGRPKGKRGSYIQHEEEDIPPQVVFEILSPSNTKSEMEKKLDFYDRYGVSEYYLYDPGRITFSGWARKGKKLRPARNVRRWHSPGLEITFRLRKTGLDIYDPSGRKFTTFLVKNRKMEKAESERELQRQRADKAESEKELQRQRADKEKQRADKEKRRADKEQSEKELEKQRADKEQQRADMLAAKLKLLGITV